MRRMWAYWRHVYGTPWYPIPPLLALVIAALFTDTHVVAGVGLTVWILAVMVGCWLHGRRRSDA